MAPTARQFAEYGFDTEKYPIGFFWYAGSVDKKPQMEGRQAIMFLAPIKQTPAK